MKQTRQLLSTPMLLKSYLLIIMAYAIVMCIVGYTTLAWSLPSAPTDLDADMGPCSGGTRSVSLSWTPPPALVLAYGIYRGGVFQSWRWASQVEDPVFDFALTTVFGLAPDVDHIFTVTALDGTGESAQSTPVLIHPTACPPAIKPTPPEALQVLPMGCDAAMVLWDPPLDAGRSCYTIGAKETCRPSTIFGFQIYRTYDDATDGSPGPTLLGKYGSLAGYVAQYWPGYPPLSFFVIDGPGSWRPPAQVPLQGGQTYRYAARAWNWGGNYSDLTEPVVIEMPVCP